MTHVSWERCSRRAASRVSLVALACLLSAAAAPPARAGQASVDKRVLSVENGLLSPVRLKGGPLETMRLADQLARYKIPGVSVAVINGGKIEWAKAYGVREAGTDAAVTPETLFQAASISKAVTALAALHFVEKGVLSLDGDVNGKLVSWKVPANDFTARKPVTVRGILSHSAGLTVHGFPGYAPTVEIPSLVSVLDGVKPANTAPIRVDAIPGSLWRYSGGGFTVLQQLLIDALHKPFPRLMAETVLGPAGMRDSTFEQPLPEDRLPSSAVAHLTNGKPVEGKRHIYPEMAAAGLWTTPSDLCRFAIEVMNSWNGRSRRVIGRDMARQMLTAQKDPSGLGVFLSGSGKGLRFEHGGANEGFSCMLVAYPETGQGAAVMVNSDAGGKLDGEILRAISAAYDWPDFKPKEKALVRLDPSVLDRYAGKYEVEPGFFVTVSRQGDGLAARIPGDNAPIELLPESETHFFALDQNLELSFIRKEDGTVTGFAADVGIKAQKVDDAALVTRLADEYVREYIARNPETATFEGLPEAPDDKLSDNSLEALAAWQAKEDGWLARLAAIDGAALWGRPEWLTYGFLREALEGSKGLRVARLELWPVNQMSGWQAGLAQLASIQPVGTPAARENALARFGRVPRYLDTESHQPQGRIEARLFHSEAERRAHDRPVGHPPRNAGRGLSLLPSGQAGRGRRIPCRMAAPARGGDHAGRSTVPRLPEERVPAEGADLHRHLGPPKRDGSLSCPFPVHGQPGQGRRRDLSPRRKGRGPVRSGGRGDRAKALQGPGPPSRQEEDGGRPPEPFPEP